MAATKKTTVGIFSPRKLRAARERAGLTRRQVSHSVGVAETTVYEWEEGDPAPTPSANSLAKLAAALGVKMDDLFE